MKVKIFNYFSIRSSRKHVFSCFVMLISLMICLNGFSLPPENYYYNDFEDKDCVQFWLCGNLFSEQFFKGSLKEAQENVWFKVNYKGLVTNFNGEKAHSGVSSFKLDLLLNSKNNTHDINFWESEALDIAIDKPVFLSGYIYPENIPNGVSVYLGWHIVHDGIEGNYYIGNVITTKDGWQFFQIDLSALTASNNWKNTFLKSWYLHIGTGGNKTFEADRIVIYVQCH